MKHLNYHEPSVQEGSQLDSKNNLGLRSIYSLFN